MEIWKDIPSYEGLYQASNKGNIKSLSKKVRHPKGGWSNRKERVLKPTNYGGYYQVDLCKEGKVKRFVVHRVIADLFVENEHKKPQVNHIDGNKLNNESSNLEWVTASENVLHAYKNGLSRHMRGELNGHAKVTELDVIEMRRMYSSGHTQLELSEIYGLSESSVQNIVNYDTWKHIK